MWLLINFIDLLQACRLSLTQFWWRWFLSFILLYLSFLSLLFMPSLVLKCSPESFIRRVLTTSQVLVNVNVSCTAACCEQIFLFISLCHLHEMGQFCRVSSISTNIWWRKWDTCWFLYLYVLFRFCLFVFFSFVWNCLLQITAIKEWESISGKWLPIMRVDHGDMF